MMKIVFISFYNNAHLNTLGFIKKDLEKTASLNSLDNVECLFVSFSDTIAADVLVEKHHLIKKIEPFRARKFFNGIEFQKHMMTEVQTFLDTQKFDALLCRYDMATYPLLKLVKHYNKKIFFEHNTKEYSENLLRINERRSKLKFSFKPGYFIYYFEGKIWPLFCEKIIGPKIRKIAESGFAVTNEIADYQKKMFSQYNVKVVTNGITYDNSMIHKKPFYNGDELKLFILLGTKALWHGIDRIISGLAIYEGKCKITIDVIGYFSEEDIQLVKKAGLDDKIKFIDALNKDEMNNQLNNYHISIGTLALHRKKLKEATTLKVRESLMRGFPTILAYKDTDFIEESEINQFLLQLPADESPLDFNKVINFANKVLKVENYNSLIHELAKPKIDFKVKATEIVQFINDNN